MTSPAVTPHQLTAKEGEGAFLIFRPLANSIGAPPAPVTGRAGCPENPAARPVPSVAETHLGKLPC